MVLKPPALIPNTSGLSLLRGQPRDFKVMLRESLNHVELGASHVDSSAPN